MKRYSLIYFIFALTKVTQFFLYLRFNFNPEIEYLNLSEFRLKTHHPSYFFFHPKS